MNISNRINALLMLVFGLSVNSSYAGTLDDVIARGKLICGVSGGLVGFSDKNADGVWEGLDVDYCRSLAAAIFNDDTKVEYVALDATDRFSALTDKKIDVLARNTTWTLRRDTGSGMQFVGANFYDGQGFLVKKQKNINSIKDLKNAKVCVIESSTSKETLNEYSKLHKLNIKSVTFATEGEAQKEFFDGECVAYSCDASNLAAILAQESHKESKKYKILSTIISKEPLGPVVRSDDNQWFSIARWTLFASIQAEELGINSENVTKLMKSSDNDAILKFLGAKGDLGVSMGLKAGWSENIIRLVGNYGESFERNVGKDSKLRLDRGLNNLWTNGGLMYSPPTV